MTGYGVKVGRDRGYRLNKKNDEREEVSRVDPRRTVGHRPTAETPRTGDFHR